MPSTPEKKTAVFLAGFGGPEKKSEIRPFLESIASTAKIPKERLVEVELHYERVGGKSDFNKITFKQEEALRRLLKKRGLPLQVFSGFMHSKPSFERIFKELKAKGITRALVFVLSVFRSYPSFERYQEKLVQARVAAEAEGIEFKYASAFHANPLFIQAVSERVLDAVKKIPQPERSKTYYLFTAHSIPLDWAKKGDYSEEFQESAFLTARKLGLQNWGLSYQSRSGPPKYPWLEPDVNEAIRKLPPGEFTRVVLVPIGFLCDNVEVTYDLDIQAKKTAQVCGIGYSRALTVMDHPAFIEMIADLIKKRSG